MEVQLQPERVCLLPRGARPRGRSGCAGADAFGGLDLLVQSATLDGTTYNEVNSLNAEAFATIGFSSTHVLP